MIAIQINEKTHLVQGTPADAAALRSLLVGTGATGNDLDGGSSPSDVPGATCASLAPEKRLYGPASAPADLLNFVRAYAVRDAVAALGLAVGTVHRLRQGYWPADPRKIMEAWSQYKAKRGMEVSSWFLRRVRVGGLVRHAGADYSAPLLAARTGQMLAVARAADGGLLAQTLEMPAERLQLLPVAELLGDAA